MTFKERGQLASINLSFFGPKKLRFMFGRFGAPRRLGGQWREPLAQTPKIEPRRLGAQRRVPLAQTPRIERPEVKDRIDAMMPTFLFAKRYNCFTAVL